MAHMLTRSTTTEQQVRLMCVVAHPDDETFGFGGTLAHYADMGVEISLVCATRGERGWLGPADDYPGPTALGEIRERELLAAAEILGIQEVHFLGYMDGEVAQANPDEITGKLVAEMRRFRPHVVITFDPMGGYGHPDHIAISQATTAAVTATANPLYFAGPWPPFQVEKLYYLAWNQTVWDRYEAAFGEMAMNVDGVNRYSQSWADWAITTRIDANEQWQRVLAAAFCHGSQLGASAGLALLDEEEHRLLWGDQQFYRTMSLVNGGRRLEIDLFEGIRSRLARRHHGRTAGRGAAGQSAPRRASTERGAASHVIANHANTAAHTVSNGFAANGATAGDPIASVSLFSGARDNSSVTNGPVTNGAGNSDAFSSDTVSNETIANRTISNGIKRQLAILEGNS